MSVDLKLARGRTASRPGPRAVHAAVALACALVGAGVLAQAPPPALSAPQAPAPEGGAERAPPAAVLRLRGFAIEGDNPLSARDESLALAPFLRAELTLDTLQQAVQALENALKAQGHSLHRVVLAPQEVTDTVTLRIVSFALGAVTVEGAQVFGEDNIRRSLPALRPGTTPDLAQLAVQTALANDNPAKNVQVALRASPTEPDRIEATVRVKDGSPLRWAASLSNTGSAATGRDRLTLSGTHANVGDRDHQLSAAYTTSLARPSDVSQLGLTYRLPVYGWGGMLDASVTRSSVQGQFGAFTSTGAGRTLGVRYTHHHGKDGALTRQTSVGLDDKVFDAVALNGQPVPGQQARRSRPLTLGHHLHSESDTAYWQADASLALNLPGGRGNGLLAYQSERPVITTARWVALRGQAARVSALDGGWLWGMRLQAQWSPRALIAGEQFGLGGVASVRGTGERVLAGDAGVSTSFELTTPAAWMGARGVVFIDAGWLRRHGGATAAHPARDALASAGVGLRWGQQAWAVGLDYGRVVQGSRTSATLNPDAPQRGDHKLHLNVNARF